MIISHQHRFIFFAVPKTATHAIRAALQPRLGPDDWQQQMLFGQQSLPIRALAKLGHGHISARQIQQHLPKNMWDGYFKFAFVRNPFDRFVSTCFFLQRKDADFARAANSSMHRLISTETFRRRILVRPQSELLTDDSGNIALDFIGRYEALQESFDTVCAAIGIPPIQLSTRNSSKHALYSDYYDAQLQQLVSEFYADDFRLFTYDTDIALRST